MGGIWSRLRYCLKRRRGIRRRGVLVRRRGVWWRPVFAVAACRAPLPVETLLILAAPVRSIVLLAPLVGLLATMVLTATKRTAEIPPIRVPRMRQEANPTMAAVDRTACQTGTIAQDGIQRELILTNKRTGAVVLMPILAKRKEFPDGYDKNARFSVKMLIVLSMSSSYSLDANASRRRAGMGPMWTTMYRQVAAGWWTPIGWCLGPMVICM